MSFCRIQMDLNDFVKHGAGTRDGKAPYSFNTPTTSCLSSWRAENVHKPTAWEKVLESSRECRHPILLSEAGQKVVRAIRQIYTARQPINSQYTPKQGLLSD